MFLLLTCAVKIKVRTPYQQIEEAKDLPYVNLGGSIYGHAILD